MTEKLRGLSRRHFIHGTGTLLAGRKLEVRSRTKISKSAASNLVMPEETLGRTGVMVSKLGVDCAPFGDKHVDVDDVAAILRQK